MCSDVTSIGFAVDERVALAVAVAVCVFIYLYSTLLDSISLVGDFLSPDRRPVNVAGGNLNFKVPSSSSLA